jgi:hypothetical protein
LDLQVNITLELAVLAAAVVAVQTIALELPELVRVERLEVAAPLQ